MSANDELPSLRGAESLIREALRDGVPTIGHCLGGQLIARALGAPVARRRRPKSAGSRCRWLTRRRRALVRSAGRRIVFQWHHEAFALPPGAAALAGSDCCPHQAFAIGPLLAMQFHLEVDTEKIIRWSHEASDRWAAARRETPASVRTDSACATASRCTWRRIRRWPTASTRAGWRRAEAARRHRRGFGAAEDWRPCNDTRRRPQRRPPDRAAAFHMPRRASRIVERLTLHRSKNSPYGKTYSAS